jgi:glycosyltransferase involved in cell wall biosynthesis
MTYDYGERAQGFSYEYRNFHHSLKSYCEKQNWGFINYDFMDRGIAIGLDLMTQELFELAKKEKPTHLFAVLFDFHRDPRHEVFKRISELGTITIHWFCDDHWRFEKYSSIVATNFDFVCTTANSALPKYENLGIADKVIKTQWACNHELYVPYDIEKDIDISLVGRPHGGRKEVIEAMTSSGLSVEVFGHGWKNRPRLPFNQMVRVFSRSKINLNLSNSSETGQQIKGRNFEVPGTRSFLLTGNADNLKEYYEDGKEIVIFNSTDELIDKASYYLSHDIERQRIAENGYQRTLAEHTWHHRYDTIFKHIEEHARGKSKPVVNHNPLVSVIIPCYKQAEYLPEAVESVVNQSFTDWECIIVNDGSPDNTSEVANQLIVKYPDKNIRLLEKENGGLADARNFGIKNSKGKYILPLDADDCISTDMLHITVDFLESNPDIAITYGDSWRFGAANEPMIEHEYNLSELLSHNLFSYCALFRREAWEAVGGYNTNMIWGYEDWDFWIGCGEKGFIAKKLPHLFLNYRVKENSMISKALEHDAELKAQIVLNHPALYGQEKVRWAETVLRNIKPQYTKKPPQDLKADDDSSFEAIDKSGSENFPLVSITIPCYNQAQFLGDCLNSLLAQTYPYWEATVVDDYSTKDNPEEVVKQFGDKRIKIVRHEQNKGLAASRNTGFMSSKANLLVSIDADDLIAPSYLQKTVAALNRTPAAECAFTDFQLFGAKEERWNNQVKNAENMTIGQWIPGAGTLMRRSLWERIGGYSEAPELRPGNEDWDFWLGAAELNVKSVHISEALYLYRQHPVSMRNNLNYLDFQTREFMYQRHKSLFDRFGTRDNFLMQGYTNSARESWKRGERLRALLVAIKAGRFLSQVPTPFMDIINSVSGLNVEESAKELISMFNQYQDYPDIWPLFGKLADKFITINKDALNIFQRVFGDTQSIDEIKQGLMPYVDFNQIQAVSGTMNYEQQKQYYLSVLKNRSTDVQSWLEFAQHARENNDPETSKAAFEAVAALDPTNPEARVYLKS